MSEGEGSAPVRELLVVAVEASADLHGAAVLRELRSLDPSLKFFGSAGPLMRDEGCEALVRAETLGVMGLVEVLPAIPRLLAALKTLAAAARARRPRAALLIDSPDFNLRLARKLKPLAIPAAYFIGPSVWAWRTYRVKQIARDVQRMLVILPFEQAFYADHHVAAIYVGNPLGDRLALRPDRLESNRGNALEIDELARSARKRFLGLDPAKPVLALLPGSRRQEIERLWRPMLESAALLLKQDPTLQFVTPVAPTIEREGLQTVASELQIPVTFLDGRAPELLSACDAAVVASGTASLEAALQLCPMVVVYRMSWLSYFIARLLVRVKFIALPNLLARRALVPELIQGHCNPQEIAARVAPLLRTSEEREQMREGLRALRDEVAPVGAPNVARKVALELLAMIGKR